MTKNLVGSPPVAKSVTPSEAIACDHRSPVDPMVAFDFDAFLTDRCAVPSVICEHSEYTVLRNYKGSVLDDHESLDAQCRTCGEYVVVTIWSTREETDICLMSDEKAFEYEEAERLRKREEDGPRDCSPMLTVFNDGRI